MSFVHIKLIFLSSYFRLSRLILKNSVIKLPANKLASWNDFAIRPVQDSNASFHERRTEPDNHRKRRNSHKTIKIGILVEIVVKREFHGAQLSQ